VGCGLLFAPHPKGGTTRRGGGSLLVGQYYTQLSSTKSGTRITDQQVCLYMKIRKNKSQGLAAGKLPATK
jgi:hypothetical protein